MTRPQCRAMPSGGGAAGGVCPVTTSLRLVQLSASDVAPPPPYVTPELPRVTPFCSGVTPFSSHVTLFARRVTLHVTLALHNCSIPYAEVLP